MAKPIDSLEALLAPVSVAEFLSEYRGKKPLHIKGAADKFADVMSWEALSGLINQTSIWSSASLQLVMDGERVVPGDYCTQAMGRDGGMLMMPNTDRVRKWLQQGASLLLNDIDQLTPGIKSAAATLESGLGGKVQCNLYCSWKEHPGFGSHYDTHEVFAAHITGEKTWRLYECPTPEVIRHARFLIDDDAYHERQKGKLTDEVTLQPGDLLYIPRGWYHDALAKSEATIHVAMGLTCPIGLDLIGMLFERAVADPLFRSVLPQSAGTVDKVELAAHLAALGDRIAEFAREPAVIDQFAAFADAYRYPRGNVALPGDAIDRRYQRASSEIRLERYKGAWLITDGRQGAPIPDGMREPIAWMLERPHFAEGEFAEAFDGIPDSARSKLLSDMQRMAVIAPA